MVQPPIPTSIPGTVEPAYEPDSAIATGPGQSMPPGELRGGPRRRTTVAFVVLAAIIAVATLWALGDHRSHPTPVEPTPPVAPRT